MKKLFIVVFLLIAACAAPADQVCCEALTPSCMACSEGLGVEEFCRINPMISGCIVPELSPEPTPELEPTLIFDEATQKLQEKGMKSTNYKFSHAELPENKAQRTYYVRDDKVRVELFTPSIREANSFDVVYLDLLTKKAAAYCELGNHVTCPDTKKLITNPDFDEYYIELPHELITRLDNGELVSSLTYDNSVADIVKTQIDDVYVRLTVNRFYGIPEKVEIYLDETYTGEPAGQQNRDFAFNIVSEEQVTPLDGW